MIVDFANARLPIAHDLCVVGSGPIGIALALSAAGHGLKVLVLESGLADPSEFHIQLGDGQISDPSHHTNLTEACCRALGGTGHWWGGRCIPFDPIDFSSRTGYPSAPWPIGYEDVAPWHAAAAKYFNCGPAEFSFPSKWPDLKGLRFDQIERWCRHPNMAIVHRQALEQSPDITVIIGATVVDLELSADRRSVRGLTVADADRRQTIASTCVTLACGGVQTPRLLLAVQRREQDLFGGPDGPLGRYYMGHNFGKLAELVLDRPQEGRQLDFFIDNETQARRRFTFPENVSLRQALPNISFAASNAKLSDPSHRSGALSLLWLVLASPLGKRLLPDALLRIYLPDGPRPYAAHIRNILFNLPSTFMAGVNIYRDKYINRPSKPSIFLHSAGGRYSLHYHAEQTPDAANRITLSDQVDALGTPRVKVDFRYSREDAERVVHAHEILAQAVRDSGVGRIELDLDREASIVSVLAQARDGMHQIGATRMSSDPTQGVVNADCRVHGLDNLYVASSSVFPTSGTANPTFLGVTLALRLADHLAQTVHPTAKSDA